MEQKPLKEVKDNGQILVLIDGRKLHVDPRDWLVAMRWLPNTILEISHINVDPIFNLRVKGSGTSEEIRASWK
jgi:hypothetical protein